MSPSRWASAVLWGLRKLCQPPREQKVFAASVRRAFESNNVRALFHVTDRSNLDSIHLHGGLYSWAGCETQGIVIAKPGGDAQSRQSDRRKGLEHFVRLSLNANQPQVYVWNRTGRLPSPVILEIDPVVATWHDTQYSNENAVAWGAIVGGAIREFRSIRLDVATAARWNGNEEKRWYQAEVLVRDHIPIAMITNWDKVY